MAIKGDYTLSLNAKTTAPTTGTNCSVLTQSLPVNVKLKPEKIYTLELSATSSGTDGGLATIHLEVSASSNHVVYIDGVETSVYDGSGSGCGSGQGFTKSLAIVVKNAFSGGAGTGGDGTPAAGSDAGGFNVDLSLGGLSDGSSAGGINLSSGTISPDLFTPAALNYVSISPEVEVIRASGTNTPIRQVKAPEVLADVATLTATSYEIRFYPMVQVGSKVGGFYQITGSPMTIWQVSSPTSSASAPKLKMIKTKGVVVTEQTFEYNSMAGSWMSTIPGACCETRIESPLPNGDKKIETFVMHPNGTMASVVQDVFHAFPWGTEKISSTNDPGGANLTATWTFHELATDVANYGRLKWSIKPDGSWERYEYYVIPANTATSSAFGKIKNIYRPWKDGLDVAGGSHPSTATMANSHVTTYTYACATDSTYFHTNVQTTSVSVLNQVISTTPAVSHLNGTIMVGGVSLPVEIRSEGIQPNCKETATFKPHISVPEYLQDRVAYSREFDGRKKEYTYEKGTYTVATGVFTVDPVGTCIRTHETEGTMASPQGIAGKTLRRVTITDPGGNSLSEELQVRTGTGHATLSLTRHTYDAMGHLTQTTIDGRITDSAVWANDRLTSETDETGISTTYDLYDAKDRVIQETRLGVVTTRIYDAAGGMTSSSRSAGGLILTSSTRYDDAGRVETETAEDGFVTTSTYPGPRTTTRINPDTSTESTETYLDGQTKSVTGTAVAARYHDYGLDVNGLWTKESIGSPTSSRYSQSWTNLNGNVWRSAISGPAGPIYSTTSFDAVTKERVLSQTVPGEASILHAYDPDTAAFTTKARDLNGNGIIDYVGADAIEKTEILYVLDGNWYRQIVSSRYESDNQATATVVSTTREQLSGLGVNGLSAASQSIDPQGNVSSQTTTINRTTRTVTTTTDSPDSNLNAVQISIDGKPSTSTTDMVSTPTVYNSYDALERPTTVTSPRGVVTTTVYHPTTGRVTSVTQAGKQTSYTYHPSGMPGAGKVATETLPDSKVIRTSYTLRGEVFRMWGDATYPLERSYDSYGQPQFLKTYRAGTGWTGTTWPTAPGTADLTEWKYFEATGSLHQKLDAAGKATTYAYHSDGKMQTRQRARGPVTTYTWNNRGLLESTTHSDGTPPVTTVYDRANRPRTLVDAAGTHTYNYSVPLKITETIVGGILGGVSRSATRDTYERPSAISVTSGGATHATSYQYSATSRLDSVNTGTETASYGYLPNSDFAQTLTFNSGTTTQLTTTRSYDSSDRLEGVTHAYGPSPSQIQSFGVSEFDNMNRRKKITREDATRWNYGYNDKGEVTSGIREKTATPNTAVPGWNYGYSFDEIGNRLGTTSNGRASTYTSNNLNQITSRNVPRAFDVIGKASTVATVTVNTQATTRLDEFFYKELPAGSGAVHIPYSVAANDGSGTTTRSGGKFLAASPEISSYDFDGNLTADGRFSYTWDAENRLIAMETLATVPVVARRKLAFAYDSMGRRIRKMIWHGTASSTWQPQLEIRFLHELGGWNIQAEITADSRFLRTYTWGTDLGGSLSGAGGVGGLLLTKIHSNNSIHAHGMDLNGNVTLLVSTNTGQATATYDYGAFGEPLRESGEYAKLNPYRFSTKYTDDETGLLDYGYRYYDPSTGRWPNRDPIEENGGYNLYAFFGNDNISKIDFLGTYIFSNESEEFRDKIIKGIKKLAGGSYEWLPQPVSRIVMPLIKGYDSSSALVLVVQANGSGRFWNDLSPAFERAKTFVLIKSPRDNYAGGANTGLIRRIVIPLLPKIDIPVYNGNVFISEKQSYESLLWHELVGHGVKSLEHPQTKWNTYEFINKKRDKSQQALWEKGDPTISYENLVRKFLGEKLRRPQYWDKQAHWPKQQR